MICSIDGCTKKVYAKKMCALHYKRVLRVGSPYVSRPCLHLPVKEKFWLYVKKGTNDECWEWTGFKDKDGYGKLRTGKTNTAAHRISYRLHYGKIDSGMLVLHKCNNTSCVNPDHLYQGTQVDNMAGRKLAGNQPQNETHPNTKISNADVLKIRALNKTYKELSMIFGISESQVGNIKRYDQRTGI